MSSGAGAVNGLIDGKGLAERLGVSPGTIRSWRSRGVSWLPEPTGRLDGLVWQEADVARILEQMPSPHFRTPVEVPAVRADRLIDLSARKARGAYFTPKDAAHFMAKWIVRTPGETYIEPSLGDGIFVESVKDVIDSAGFERPRWIVSELDEATAYAAVERGLVSKTELRVGDYLTQPVATADAVIANPPFVRLRHLSQESRQAALSATERYLGKPMALKGSIWMPFVAKMVASVKEGGRMAVVLPLDFTYVSYALALWEYLGESFSSVRVLRSRERIFPEISQDVVIVLADGRGGTTSEVSYEAYETLADLVAQGTYTGGSVRISSVLAGERAFQRALLPDGLAELLEAGQSAGWMAPASSLAKFRIGYVSGNKKFFHPSVETVTEYDLPSSSLLPALVNSKKLRGQGVRTSGMNSQLADRLWTPGEELTVGESAYISYGERLGVQNGYKASSRTPWFRVPMVDTPDAIITVFSERPLVLVNDGAWVPTNSFLCAYTRSGSAEEFAAAWYSPLSLLSVELEVHSLGGGVVIMVPNEASRVRVLNPEIGLGSLDRVDEALRRGDISAAYAAGESQLAEYVGVDGLDLVRQGAEVLSRWRTK